MRQFQNKAIFLSVMLALVLSGCCLSFFKVSSLTMSHTSMRLSVGAQQDISVKMDQEKYLGTKNFEWFSSNSSVVAIVSTDNEKATLRGLKEGVCTITVSIDDKQASCSVSVIEWNGKITKLQMNDLTIAAGESVKLDPYIEPVPPIDLKSSVLETLSFETQETNIISLDKHGVVTAIEVGTATVKVSSSLADSSVVGAAKIKVIEESDTMIAQDSIVITMHPKEISILEGSKYPLIVTTLPEVEASKIIYTSSDSTKVTVDTDGVIEGIASGKKIEIKATCYGKSASCFVDVLSSSEVDDIDHIQISDTSAKIAVNQEKLISAAIFPVGYGDNSQLQWSITPSEGAIITTNDNECRIVATQTGTYQIEVKYPKKNGEFASQTCTVEVVQISSIEISSSLLTLHKSETATLTAKIFPAGVEGIVSWESSNTAVATVSFSTLPTSLSTVNITPVSDGETTITAKCGNALATCEITVTSKVSELTLSTLELVKLCVGEDIVLSAIPNVPPETGAYSWSSNDTSIVSIDTVQGGSPYERKITGKASGTTQVVVTADEIVKEFSIEVSAEGASNKMVEYLVKSGTFEYKIENPQTAKSVYFVLTNTSNSKKTGISINSTGAMPSYSQLSDVTNEVSYETYQSYENATLYETPYSVTKFNNDPSVLKKDGLVVRPLFDSTPSQVGDTRSFYALNYSDQTITVESTLKLKRTVLTAFGEKTLEIWVETTSFTDGLVTQANVEKFANQFLIDGLNNDIYDYVTNIAGEEWGDANRYSNLIPDTDKIIILLLDSSQGTGNSSYAGYFHSLHNLVRNDSNQELMFFIDCNSLSDSYQFNWRISTLAHEFQHMIHWYQKQIIHGVLSEVWFNEMCSMAIEDIVATKLGSNPTEKLYSRMQYYLKQPNKQLTYWVGTSNDYAHSMMFGAYLLRNYGGATLLSQMIKSAAISLDDIPALIDKQNTLYILRRWGTAVLLSDTIIGDVSAYPEISFKHNEGEINSIFGPITYTLKDLDFINQRQYGSIFKRGPEYITGVVAGASIEGHANRFYYAGEVIPGSDYKWEITLPSGVEITIVKK